ncbi:hypothetical protein BSNK01_28310 [Bacillaceae bacterium]
MALTSLDKAKRYLKIESNEHDELIQDLITAASTAIETYTSRIFVQKSYTELYDGKGLNYLVLRQAPIVSVSEVKIDDQTLPAEDYAFYAETGVLRRKTGFWPEGVQNIEVSYTAGYSTVPPDVEQAVILLVAAWFKTDISDFSNLINEAGGIVRPEAFPSRVRALLDPYRRLYL